MTHWHKALVFLNTVLYYNWMIYNHRRGTGIAEDLILFCSPLRGRKAKTGILVGLRNNLVNFNILLLL